MSLLFILATLAVTNVIGNTTAATSSTTTNSKTSTATTTTAATTTPATTTIANATIFIYIYQSSSMGYYI